MQVAAAAAVAAALVFAVFAHSAVGTYVAVSAAAAFNACVQLSGNV